ncbi:MYXO-CTERM sorting domain-containing protein [Uliginosibacterium sp. sgz301328]|uniref:MYXO-CTERM sorting domain-containing protein n=1 Tax=Uliginosibacterium sp. sgz301328 TaxID=3243764 RepID=UPI00359DB946
MERVSMRRLARERGSSKNGSGDSSTVAAMLLAGLARIARRRRHATAHFRRSPIAVLR